MKNLMKQPKNKILIIKQIDMKDQLIVRKPIKNNLKNSQNLIRIFYQDVSI